MTYAILKIIKEINAPGSLPKASLKNKYHPEHAGNGDSFRLVFRPMVLNLWKVSAL